MLKRRMMIGALAGAAILLAVQPGLAESGPGSGGDDNGDDRGRGRGRGRGGDDVDDDRRGGGASSGHGSSEERAAAVGDSRGDRSDSRLREDIHENEIRGRLGGLSGGGSERPVLGPPPSSEGRGFFADLFRSLR